MPRNVYFVVVTVVVCLTRFRLNRFPLDIRLAILYSSISSSRVLAAKESKEDGE